MIRKAGATLYVGALFVVIFVAGAFYAVWGAVRDAAEDFRE